MLLSCQIAFHLMIEIKNDVSCPIFRLWTSIFRHWYVRLYCLHVFRGVCGNLSSSYTRACTPVHARAWKRPVRACTRGCVGACNAREMRRTTIQILLLLLREQSPVNRPPRHNVSIQVRSAVLNRSGSTLCKCRKSTAETGERSSSVSRHASRNSSVKVPFLHLCLYTHEENRCALFSSCFRRPNESDSEWLVPFYL